MKEVEIDIVRFNYCLVRPQVKSHKTIFATSQSPLMCICKFVFHVCAKKWFKYCDQFGQKISCYLKVQEITSWEISPKIKLLHSPDRRTEYEQHFENGFSYCTAWTCAFNERERNICNGKRRHYSDQHRMEVHNSEDVALEETFHRYWFIENGTHPNVIIQETLQMYGINANYRHWRAHHKKTTTGWNSGMCYWRE